MSKKNIRCLECLYCNEMKKKCYPQSNDCGSEYDLDKKDIYEYRKNDCEFYKPKIKKDI